MEVIQFQFQPSSAEIVASIHDLLKIILSRLPIQSLLRFKLVSKTWLSLITSPVFCCLRNPNPNPAAGIFMPSPPATANPGEHHDQYDYIPFGVKESRNQSLVKTKFGSDKYPASGIRILQSCNGLMLCCSNYGTDHRSFVYNPTTGESSALPKTDEINGFSKTICGMNLAFDPAKSPHYSVVSVWSVPENIDPDNVSRQQLQIEIYSSETGSWTKCGAGEPFTSLANFEQGIYWNGSINWLCTIGDGESLYLDIGEQKLRKMPSLPLTYSTYCKRDQYYFGESSGHLHLVDLRGPPVKFNVHELKTDYSGWFVKYRVDISAVVAANPCMVLYRHADPMYWCGFVFSIFTVVRGEEEEEDDSFLALQIPGKAVRYNIVRKCFDDLVEIKGGVKNRSCSLRYPKIGGFQYIQSICRV